MVTQAARGRKLSQESRPTSSLDLPHLGKRRSRNEINSPESVFHGTEVVILRCFHTERWILTPHSDTTAQVESLASDFRRSSCANLVRIGSCMLADAVLTNTGRLS